MKSLKNSIVLSLIVITIIHGQKSMQNSLKQKNCLSINDFSLVKNYVSAKGKLIKTHISISKHAKDNGMRSRNGRAEMNTGALEISINDRYLTLTSYQDLQKIIIINNNKDENIEPYFISNINNKLKISAYYSRLDTKETVRARKEDWCNLIEQLKLLMKLPKNCE